MSQIHGVGGGSPVQRAQAKQAYQQQPVAPASTRQADTVELSPQVQALLDKIQSGADVRMDKVQEIRAQIASGKYETPEKLDVATDKLLDDLIA